MSTKRSVPFLGRGAVAAVYVATASPHVRRGFGAGCRYRCPWRTVGSVQRPPVSCGSSEEDPDPTQDEPPTDPDSQGSTDRHMSISFDSWVSCAGDLTPAML